MTSEAAANSTSKPARARRSAQSFAWCLVALAVCTYADLGSKNWAMDTLSRAPLTPPGPVCVPGESGFVYFQRVQKPAIVLIEDYLELRYAENCGAAFGVLNRGPSWLRLALFSPAAILATLGLLWMYFTGYGGKLFAVSVPLIASGALGNLVDRFRFGYVVDFIRFHVHESFVWPTFNVADSTIFVGVALLLIEGFVAPRANNTAAGDASSDAARTSAGAKAPRL